VLDRGPHADNGIATGLAELSAPARIAWISFRTLAAVVTVPLAEELAFRGFLLRRLISADFDAVDFRRFTYFAVLGSSVAFGLMHGDRWLAGTVAGILYAMVMIRRGSIGAAVLAHATTNGLLAAWVLIGGNWHLW
jgi:CAAX prenyl protease-like protein